VTLSPDRVRAARPDLATAIDEHYAELVGALDPAIAELCRRHVVRLLDGGDAPPQADAGLTGRERACLALAEQFVFSAQWVSDEHVSAVTEYMEPGQVLALVALVSLVERTERLERFLGSAAEVA
jgi:hypothetical protein